MTSTPTPTWYDVLAVPPDATAGEIKAAWRSATDKFEPGSGPAGQFRMFNEAADVLLDPERRAAYDQTLAAQHPVSLTEPSGPEPSAVVPVTAAALPSGRADSETATTASVRLVALCAVLALLTVAVMVLAVVFGLKVQTGSRVADARDEAPAAAERAAKAVLSYNYETLPADRKRASAYLTDDFEKEYLKNFTLLEKQQDGTPGAAVQTKTVVTSSVLGSGVMDAREDVVRVLVYVNQVSTRPGRDPQIFQNRAAMTMEKDGNRWLVDDLKSY